MVRIILGVIVGFVAWTIIWLGSDYVLTASLDWYAKEQSRLAVAMFNHKGTFDSSINVLLLNLGRSVIDSFLVGYLTAVVADENRKSPMILGILLLATGIFFEAMAWNYVPIWYHVVFLVLLIPVTVAGAKLKRFSRVAPMAEPAISTADDTPAA